MGIIQVEGCDEARAMYDARGTRIQKKGDSETASRIYQTLDYGVAGRV